MEENTKALKPVKKDSLYLKISDAIYSYIRMNNLQTEDKLPSEREMAAMLQTSRNSVREALRILEDRGLINVKVGKGVFINNPYGQSGSFSVRLADCSLKEIYELQSVLEHRAVEDAIQLGTQKEMEKLVSIAEEMMQLADRKVYSHTLDYGFHQKLYESCGNSAIHQLLDKIREYRFVRQEASGSGNDSVWLPTIRNHLFLARAILKHDLQAAMREIDAINNYGYKTVGYDAEDGQS